MSTLDAAVIVLFPALVGFGVLYVVIRAAVSAGILDADRKRQQAEAERQRVVSQRRAAGMS